VFFHQSTNNFLCSSKQALGHPTPTPHTTMANFAPAPINYGTMSYKFPCREKYSPGRFTFYRRFFNGCKWELALRPNKSIDAAWEDAKRHNVNHHIKPIPGVYEFSIASSPGGKRFKVYVGMTTNMQNRQGDHLSGRSNIATFLDAAVRQGFFVYRRVRYIIPCGPKDERSHKRATVMAGQVETRILGKYNYAWNKDVNGDVEMTRMPVKSSFLCFCTGIKWIKNSGAYKFDN